MTLSLNLLTSNVICGTTLTSILGFLELFFLELEAGIEETDRQTDTQTWREDHAHIIT